ncbi:hypothetical protein K9L16_04275 [Candidatus Pacearchaeota archaeon]|nr:hypothetical protein [Candidatus Pacearchaeota archaeon]
MEAIKVLVWTPLNTSGFDHNLEIDKDWINTRINLMNKYVIPSMNNQTDKNFLWFIEIREDTIDLIAPKLKLNNNNFKIISRPINKDETCKAFIRQKKDIDKYIGTRKFYDVRLNSDDMYINTFIETLKSVKIDKKTQAIIPRKGFMWYILDNIVVKRVQESPPFSTLIYNTEDFLDGFYYYMPTGHCEVKLLSHKIIKDPMWCVIVHDKNNKIYRLGKYTSHKKFIQASLETLKDFGYVKY